MMVGLCKYPRKRYVHAMVSFSCCDAEVFDCEVQLYSVSVRTWLK